MISLESIEQAIAGDLEIVRGTDITWQDTVVDLETKSEIDISNATITFTVKENISDTTAVITKTVGSGIVINADQVSNKGNYQLSLVPSDTSGLDVKLYEYDIHLTLGGKTNAISRGTLNILSDVT